MGSSDSDGQAPPSRKRSRTSANGDDARKARGRPRVDTQDETAADRRRTQIRLAQRAYRQRKETTISSLKERNDRLRSVIDQMNKSFLQFNEATLKTGLYQLNPDLAQQLKTVTESFITLSRSALKGHEDDEEVNELIEPALTRAKPQSTQAQLLDVEWGYSAPLEERTPPQRPTPSPPREPQSQNYDGLLVLPNFNTEEATQGGIVHHKRPVMAGQVFSQGVSWAPLSLEERPCDHPLPFGLVELRRQEYKLPSHQNTNIYSVKIPTPRATPPMPRLPTPPSLSLSTKRPTPVWTYSHDETTFARRLMRASLEAGFHLLSSANQRPAALEYVFRLSLPWMSLDALRERFKELLSRGTDEDLDYWGTPFIHLGGAGTHFPRKDAQGNIINPPNTWTVRRIGPIEKKMIRAENAGDPSQSHDLNIDLTGFEGEWFDAYDVEGYLEHKKGVRIDPKSSFVDALIDDDEQSFSDYGNDYFNINAGQKTASLPRRTSEELDAPSFSISSAGTGSSIPTPPNNSGNIYRIGDHLFAPSDIPFGLDMNMSSDLNNVPNMDSSAFFDQPLGLDLAPGFDISLNNVSLPPLNFPGEGVNMGGLGAGTTFPDAEAMPVVRQRRKKAVLIDVTKLVDEITKHGVCLGRAPGFRRKDVDMAFQASLVTAF